MTLPWARGVRSGIPFTGWKYDQCMCPLFFFLLVKLGNLIKHDLQKGNFGSGEGELK